MAISISAPFVSNFVLPHYIFIPPKSLDFIHRSFRACVSPRIHLVSYPFYEIKYMAHEMKSRNIENRRPINFEGGVSKRKFFFVLL